MISGHGSAGGSLAEALARAGADVVVSDVDPAARDAAQRLGYGWVSPEEAVTAPADILVPAAVGGIFGADTGVGARLVVGPANNQLVDDETADALAARGVVWVPDYVASAGGAVYALAREIDGVGHETAAARVEGIGDVVARLLAAARTNGRTPHAEAGELVRRRLDAHVLRRRRRESC